MDRRERTSDMTLLLQSALQGWQSNMWTALPALYVGPGIMVGTADVQPTIPGRFLQQDGNTYGPWVNLPVCINCPISWPGGRRGRLMWPLVAGDEGLLIFSCRAIDNWWLQGAPPPPGLSPPPSMIRMHDLSDGCFFPGVFSQPGAPAGAPTPPANLRLTSDDGLTYFELDDVNKIINLVAPGGVNVNGAPTRTVLTSGSGSYTPPAGCTRVHVRMCGGGGGGSTGGAGGDTSFDAVTAKGGSPASGFTGGAGGSGGSGSPTNVLRVPGGSGLNGFGVSLSSGSVEPTPAPGGTNPFGSGGPGAGGLGSALVLSSTANTNGGGGAGEWVEFDVASPVGPIAYGVGAGGAAGASATAGHAGIIVIDEAFFS